MHNLLIFGYQKSTMMKQIVVSIPESFYNSFIEFFKHIPEARIESEESVSVPEWHKTETLKRIKSAKAKDFTPWKKGKKLLNYSTKSNIAFNIAKIK